jgi:hypothetical protein
VASDRLDPAVDQDSLDQLFSFLLTMIGGDTGQEVRAVNAITRRQ